MTLLDLINKLQKEKKIVARWEFFLRGDDFIDDEDLFCLRPGGCCPLTSTRRTFPRE